MNDALRTNVHPSSGGHLSVVGYTHLCCNFPILEVIKHTHHHRVGNNNTRRIRFRLEESERMSAFHHERLLVGHDFQVLLDEAVLHPVLAYLASFSVCHQFVRIEGNVE